MLTFKNLPPGSSQQFVLAQGFREIGGYSALIGEDNTLRLFAEILADTDRPEVRPLEAYHTLLASLQPGGMLRILQVFWPDPRAREQYCTQVQTWGSRGAGSQSDSTHGDGSQGDGSYGDGSQGDSGKFNSLRIDSLPDSPSPVQNHALKYMRTALLNYALAAPLPFSRRTILELVAANTEMVSWYEGISGVLQSFGLRLTPLSPDEVRNFAHWVFNPTIA